MKFAKALFFLLATSATTNAFAPVRKFELNASSDYLQQNILAKLVMESFCIL